jgi:hypothetical protein
MTISKVLAVYRPSWAPSKELEKGDGKHQRPTAMQRRKKQMYKRRRGKDRWFKPNAPGLGSAPQCRLDGYANAMVDDEKGGGGRRVHFIEATGERTEKVLGAAVWSDSRRGCRRDGIFGRAEKVLGAAFFCWYSTFWEFKNLNGKLQIAINF